MQVAARSAPEKMNAALFVLLRRMRLPLLVLIGVYAISVLGLVLIPGVGADGGPHRMDFFHAFYVISYTATTIGYGELPYRFTEGQRLWITFSMYLGVIGWLYAIGTLITLLQDPAIRNVTRETRFTNSVRRIAERFYVVCGYGDTGSLVVRAMTRFGLSAVVIDSDQDRTNELSLENLSVYVPGLTADASQSGNLVLAGLKHPMCTGVVALTNVDQVNLKIAITGKLLDPKLKVICRAQSHDAQANMESFGTDAVINHFDTFADRLAMALHSPDMYLIYEWLTDIPGEPLPTRIDPPRGTWILCGYGRFGKAVHRYLTYEGVPTVIVEQAPGPAGAPEGTVVGRGTEAVTLREAHIEKAVGIVAGTNDDANNLSIIMTARDINPALFLVARQNDMGNNEIFTAGGIDLVMQRSRVISNRILALIRTPLLTDFLRLARHKKNEWAQDLVERLSPVVGNVVPEVWSVEISETFAPAVAAALREQREIRLEHLLRDPADRSEKIQCMPLLLMRSEEEHLLPEDGTPLKAGDRVLFCGREGVAARMQWVLNNLNTLHYAETGVMKPEGYVWSWLARRTS